MVTAICASPRVVFRADASVAIGSGHVVRCLALAQSLRRLDWDVHFICRDHDGHLGEQITGLGFHLELLPRHIGQNTATSQEAGLGTDWQVDAFETAACLDRLAPTWLVVDHYGLDRRWEEIQASRVCQILVIDDLADRPHAAALLVDQNPQSRPDRYLHHVASDCRKLLGPRYALLRPQFEEAAARQPRRDGRVRRILACVGGSDSKNVLPTLIEAWASLLSPRPALDVVVGDHSPNLEALQRQCSVLHCCTLHIQTDRMAELMAGADLMMCAAGTLNWERCCLSLPAVMIEIAPNQHENLRLLARSRTGIDIGRAETLGQFPLKPLLRRLLERPSLLRLLGGRSQRLVDGRGASRVAAAMSSNHVRLRRATQADAEIAWQWRNSETTRRYSTDPRSIPLPDHLSWWNRAVRAEDRSLLIAETYGSAVGVVRLDHERDRAILSIYLDPSLTGLGLGVKVVDAARRWVKENRVDVCQLLAVIDSRNSASQSAFASAGFTLSGNHWVREV